MKIYNYWINKYLSTYISNNIQDKGCCSGKEIKLNFNNFVDFLDNKNSGYIKNTLIISYGIIHLWELIQKDIINSATYYHKGTSHLQEYIPLFIDEIKIY